MNIFDYGEIETSYLKKRDKVLGKVIDKIGTIQREVYPDLFFALVKSIVGQQISAKAQATIWEKIKNGLGEITPHTVLSCSEEKLQSFGISFRKVSYIRGVAQRVVDGRLDIDALHSKSDEEICNELVKIDGIGVWTAEMLLLFSMQRPDIVSYGDLAILRGMRIVYRRKEITKQLFEKYRQRYTPYGSVASLYLWAVAGGAIDKMNNKHLNCLVLK